MKSIGIIERTNKIIICTALFFFLVGATLFAAPSISGVSGTVSNSQSITISGSNFGSGPTVILFDDFENGNSGSLIGTGAVNVGSIYEVGTDGNNPTFNSSYAHSGSIAMKSTYAVSGGGSPHITARYASGFTKVFTCFWAYCPGIFPGADVGGTNYKIQWHMADSDTPTNDIDMVAVGGEWYFASNGQPNWQISFNTQSWPYPTGSWHRFWTYVALGSNGTVKCSELNNSGVSTAVSNTSAGSMFPSGTFYRTNFDAWGSTGSSSVTYLDDVYEAVGDNAQARVEIGNASTYTSCTNLTMCTPDSWSASSITAHVWKGSFGSSDSAYLFVIDSNGNVSSGYPIQFGSGGTTDTTPPATPTGVTVTILQ